MTGYACDNIHREEGGTFNATTIPHHLLHPQKAFAVYLAEIKDSGYYYNIRSKDSGLCVYGTRNLPPFRYALFIFKTLRLH